MISLKTTLSTSISQILNFIKNSYRSRNIIIAIIISTSSTWLSSQSYIQNFDNISTLQNQDWLIKNNSSSIGLNNWFQGNELSFIAYNQASNSYIAANYNSVGSHGSNNTINNWLITPNRIFKNGDTFSFYTRKKSPNSSADRLEVRLSKNGNSTNIGNSPENTGDFTNLLLNINQNLSTNGYPTAWQLYTITISGLTEPTSGRIAFRYFVNNAGIEGKNADYIGIDNVQYTTPTCPTTSLTPPLIPNILVNNYFAQNFTLQGGVEKITYSITGNIPTGTTFYSEFGQISGTPTIAGEYRFVITGIDNNGCSSSKEYILNVEPDPLTANISQSNPKCFGQKNGTATVTAVGGTYPYNYLWNTSPSQNTATATNLAAGEYQVTITDAKGNSIIKTVSITQNSEVPPPTGSSTQTLESTSTLQNLAVTGQNITWYVSKTDATNYTNPLNNQSTLINNATYYATQKIDNCESIRHLEVTVTLNTLNTNENNFNKNKSKISPNPAENYLTIHSKKIIKKAIIFNFSGQKIMEKTVNLNNTIDVSMLSSGMYIIQLISESDTQNIKFIKK